MIINPYAFGGPKSLAYVGAVETMSRSGSTMTASSLSGGAGSRKYFMLNWWAYYVDRTLNSLTYGGVACTRVARAVEGASYANVELWYVDSAASSGDLVATFSGSMVQNSGSAQERCSVAVFTGTALTVGEIGRFDATLQSTTIGPTSAFDIPAGAWVVGGVATGEGSAMSATWSSFTEVSQLTYGAYAFDSGLSAATDHTETVTMPGNRGYRRLLCVPLS